MTDEPSKTSKEDDDSNARIIAIALAVICLGAAGYIWWSNDTHPCGEQGTMCIANGTKKHILEITGFVKSVNGLSRTNSANASLTMPGGEAYQVGIKGVKNDEWGETINQLGLGVKGVSVTGLTSYISPEFHLSFPKIEGGVGQEGKLAIDMRVAYPALEEDDNVLTRSAHNLVRMGFKFFNEAKDLKHEMRVIIQPETYRKRDWYISDIWFWLSAIIGTLALLGFIGLLVGDEDEEKEES